MNAPLHLELLVAAPWLALWGWVGGWCGVWAATFAMWLKERWAWRRRNAEGAQVWRDGRWRP